MIDPDQDYQGNYWDGDPDDPPECDHEDADFDILDGRMSCHCGYSRYLTGKEIDAELHRMSEYDRAWRRETSRWWQMYDAVRGWLWSLTHWPARRCAVASDDEIPF